MNIQPNVIIVGSARASSTALFYGLAAHPDVFPLTVKEPNWYLFSGPEHNLLDEVPPSRRSHIEGRSTKSRDGFEALFAGYKGQSVTLEASPVYLHLPGAEINICSNNPTVKIIIIKRNRAELLISMYSAFLGRDPARIEDDFFSGQLDEDCARILKFSDLNRHILRFRSVFSAEQIYEVDFEDITKRPTEVLIEIQKFLGLKIDLNCSINKMNESGSFKASPMGFFFAYLDSRKGMIRKLVPDVLTRRVMPVFQRLRSRARNSVVGEEFHLRQRIEIALQSVEHSGG